MQQKFPFGNTEAEHNAVCDTMKCRYGNYCNFLIGLCSQCREHIKKCDEYENKLREEKNARNSI